MKITVLGIEILIGCVIWFEAGGEQSKMADDETVAMDNPIFRDDFLSDSVEISCQFY